jgi:hypothetical protein
LKTVRLGLAKPLIVSARLKRNSDNPDYSVKARGSACTSVHFRNVGTLPSTLL